MQKDGRYDNNESNTEEKEAKTTQWGGKRMNAEGHMERERTKPKIVLGKVCGDNIRLSRYRDRLLGITAQLITDLSELAKTVAETQSAEMPKT